MAYMSEPKSANQPKIGYFCMEYGLHQSVRLYSGGLGVLAGDYLKEISDRNADFAAVGLLYRYGYFQQGISISGEQIHHYDPAKFTQLPLHPVRDSRNEWLKVNVNLAGRTVWAKVWELPVGRMSLYLLDTDIDDNAWEDRVITHQLYGGNNENRLRQELLLGIGGLRALNAMGIEPDLFHLNEGHAAFIGLERLRNFMREKGLSYQAALEVVRSSQLFTTHTPVRKIC
jgi:alpha-glucan phosphorylase-like protein